MIRRPVMLMKKKLASLLLDILLINSGGILRLQSKVLKDITMSIE
jgi:hypothetical protein